MAARANATGADFRLNPASEALQRALDTLRVLARGVYPPQLADAGLVTAFRSWRDGAARYWSAGIRPAAGRSGRRSGVFSR